jgi:hypothetical protein
MKIELLYFEGCPSWPTALVNLKAACELEGLAWPIELVEVSCDQDAARLRFLGSPSLRVAGQAFWPEPREDYLLSCRMYRTPDGMRGWPAVEMVRDRLRRLAEAEQAEIPQKPHIIHHPGPVLHRRSSTAPTSPRT